MYTLDVDTIVIYTDTQILILLHYIRRAPSSGLSRRVCLGTLHSAYVIYEPVAVALLLWHVRGATMRHSDLFLYIIYKY